MRAKQTRIIRGLILLLFITGSYFAITLEDGAGKSGQATRIHNTSQGFTEVFKDPQDQLPKFRVTGTVGPVPHLKSRLESIRKRPTVSRARLPRKAPRLCDSIQACKSKFPARIQVIDEVAWYADRYDVNLRRVLRVADCESDFYPQAINHDGCEGYGCGGVFQQHQLYWRGRAAKYGFRGASIFDQTANIAVSVRMMAEGGWKHWESCL